MHIVKCPKKQSGTQHHTKNKLGSFILKKGSLCFGKYNINKDRNGSGQRQKIIYKTVTGFHSAGQ